jgi:hypothetical protein
MTKPLKNTKEKTDLRINYLIKENIRKKAMQVYDSRQKKYPSLVIKEEREE